MNQETKIYARFFSIFCVAAAVCLVLFAPWAVIDGTTLTLPGLFHAVFAAGGITKFVDPGDTAAFATVAAAFVAAFSLILYLIYGIMLIFKKKLRLVSYLAYLSYFIYICSYMTFQGHESGIALPFAGIIMLIEFMVVTFCEQSGVMEENYRKMKQREKEEKEERKRRLYFPGKYPPDFARVIRTNFRYNWKNYVLFILCGILCSTFLTMASGMNRLLTDIHSAEDVVLGTGLQQILYRSIALILFTGVFMTAFVFSYYIKSRMSDYRMFSVLGIRTRTLTFMIVMEYTASLLISLVCGMILGTAGLLCLKGLLQKELNGYAQIGALGPDIYLIAIAAYVIILLFATAINYESYLQIRDSFGVIQNVQKEKVPRKWSGLILLTLLGAYLVYQSISGYTEISILSAVLFLLGVYCLVRSLAAILLKWTSASGKRYFKHLLPQIPWQYRFKKNIRYLFLLMAAHFFALNIYLFQFSSCLIAASPEELLPYDFVVMAHQEDQDMIDQIETSYQADIQEYPMVRMTVPSGTSWGFMAAVVQYSPPGQYVGISESTYRDLYRQQGLPEPEPLHLEGKEIHAVIQQDASFARRKLDDTAGASAGNPGVERSGFDGANIKLGRPQDPSGYEFWEIKSYEITILTGMLQRGAQENLLVLSDETFQECMENCPGGPTSLCLINSPSGTYKNIKAELEELRGLHADDEQVDIDIQVYYGKQQLISDIISERYSKEVLYGFVFVMFATCALFLSYVKFSYDTGDILHRYRLFSYTGMPIKEQMHTIAKEMWSFTLPPLLLSAAGSVIFHILTFGIRMYTPGQILDYLKTGGAIGIAYLLIQICWTGYLIHGMKNRIRKQNS